MNHGWHANSQVFVVARTTSAIKSKPAKNWDKSGSSAHADGRSYGHKILSSRSQKRAMDRTLRVNLRVLPTTHSSGSLCSITKSFKRAIERLWAKSSGYTL